MTIALRQRPLARVVLGIVQAAAGCWLDPSDMTTLYQDAAGTTPVTAVEQPVGKILDKSGKGNHATQSVTASRPVLSARYNLLTKTEDMANSAWIKQASGTASVPIVTNNYGIAPDGTMTASRIVYALNGGTTTTDRSVFLQSPVSIGAEYTSAVWIKSNTEQSYILQHRLGLGTQLITADQTWRKYSYTQTITDTTHWLSLRGGQGTSDSADILIWHPDLRVGSTAGPYQRVNTDTDYDTDERYFPKYLRFDRVDDYLNLPYMGLYANGGASIITGRDDLSQAIDTYIISERSTTDADPKYYPSRQLASGGNMDAYITDNVGTVVLDTIGSAFGGASNAVVSSVVDAGNNIKLFKNGALAASDNYTRAGTLTLNTTTIGASVSTTTSNYAKMKLYGLLITKSALSDAQRIQCERLLASKAGVTF